MKSSLTLMSSSSLLCSDSAIKCYLIMKEEGEGGKRGHKLLFN